MTGPVVSDEARIADIARRVCEARGARILAASRCASELEAVVRPLNDAHLLSLIARLQSRLAERLPARPRSPHPCLMTTMAETAGDRQRRYRERRRRGLMTSPADFGGEVLSTLFYLKLLSEREADEPAKVRVAISKFLLMAAPRFNPFL